MGPDFESRIASLDISLFEPILSQTSDEDRASLLSVQQAVRAAHGAYTYLEIGSYMGGSIQPHLLDERCRKIYSIDKRLSVAVPDVRGPVEYPGNEARDMLDGLRRLAPHQVDKITCLDGDARDIPASRIDSRPHLCFIDGEHTDRTAFSDFQFCLSVCGPDSVIVFHDSDLVHGGIAAALLDLHQRSVRFTALWLPEIIYLVALGDGAATIGPQLRGTGEDGIPYIVGRLAG